MAEISAITLCISHWSVDPDSLRLWLRKLKIVPIENSIRPKVNILLVYGLFSNYTHIRIGSIARLTVNKKKWLMNVHQIVLITFFYHIVIVIVGPTPVGLNFKDILPHTWRTFIFKRLEFSNKWALNQGFLLAKSQSQLLHSWASDWRI